MCFPFAADLSTEVLCSGVANVFTRDAERVFLISSPLSLGDFQWLSYCAWRVEVRGRAFAGEKMRGKSCQYIRAWMWKVNVRECYGVVPQRGDLGRQGSCCSELCARPKHPSFPLPCRDTETINLRVDLTTAPQDKGLIHSSPHGSSWVDFDFEFMLGLVRSLL